MGFGSKKESEKTPVHESVSGKNSRDTVADGLECWVPLLAKADNRKHKVQKQEIEEQAMDVHGVTGVEIDWRPTRGFWKGKIHFTAVGNEKVIAQQLMGIFDQR